MCRSVSTTLLHVDDPEHSNARRAAQDDHAFDHSPLRKAYNLALSLHPETRVLTTMEQGPVVTTLVRASRSADLVLLGSEDSAPTKMVRGAVTANVAARAWSAVEVVPVPGPKVERSRPRTRVLVVITDVAQLPELAEIAISAAACCDARLVFWETCSDRSGVPAPMGEAGEESLTRQLESALGPWLSNHPDLRCDVVVIPGPTAHEVLSSLQPSDLVVTTRGKGPAFWGRPHGLTRALVERACCPVIVVPSRPLWEFRQTRNADGARAGRHRVASGGRVG